MAMENWSKPKLKIWTAETAKKPAALSKWVCIAGTGQ